LALNSGSIGLDITPDARFISGRIGGDAAIWQAIGNPADGNYQYVSYNDGPFPHRLAAPTDGNSPNSGHFILDSDLFGTVMITNYGSTSGIRSGAWSVETGLDLQTFGHANIMKAINIDGQVYIATNDFTEHTGAIWLLGQDEPVYLRDIITDFENPYFTPGGLFALPNGEGLGILGTGKVDGVETHFMAQIKFVDKVFEYLVDIDLNGEANDMGIPHDGMTSDPGLVGDLPLGGEVHMQIGDTAQIVSGFRDGEGRFILPKEELFELFPEVENGGDFEAKIWTGVENVAEYLKTKLQFACIVSPPTEFEILGIDGDGRLTWEPSRGARGTTLVIA